MKTHKGTETVKGGFYLNLREWKLVAIDGAAGTLAGEATVEYVRVPLLGMLMLAPMLGLAFVVVLPLLGLGVVAEHGWKRMVAVAGARRAREARANPVTLRRQ